VRWTEDQLVEYRAKNAPLYAESPDTPDPGLESGLQQKVLEYCKEHGWPCFHDRSRKKNEPGWADNFIFLPKRLVVLIELKSETGTLRKEQKEKRLTLEFLGHHVYQARSFRRVVEIIQRELKGE